MDPMLSTTEQQTLHSDFNERYASSRKIRLAHRVTALTNVALVALLCANLYYVRQTCIATEAMLAIMQDCNSSEYSDYPEPVPTPYPPPVQFPLESDPAASNGGMLEQIAKNGMTFYGRNSDDIADSVLVTPEKAKELLITREEFESLVLEAITVQLEHEMGIAGTSPLGTRKKISNLRGQILDECIAKALGGMKTRLQMEREIERIFEERWWEGYNDGFYVMNEAHRGDKNITLDSFPKPPLTNRVAKGEVRLRDVWPADQPPIQPAEPRLMHDSGQAEMEAHKQESYERMRKRVYVDIADLPQELNKQRMKEWGPKHPYITIKGVKLEFDEHINHYVFALPIPFPVPHPQVPRAWWMGGPGNKHTVLGVSDAMNWKCFIGGCRQVKQVYEPSTGKWIDHDPNALYEYKDGVLVATPKKPESTQENSDETEPGTETANPVVPIGTNEGDVEQAVDAFKQGIEDFFNSPDSGM